MEGQSRLGQISRRHIIFIGIFPWYFIETDRNGGTINPCYCAIRLRFLSAPTSPRVCTTMTDSMVSEDSPDFFRVPGIKVRDPKDTHHDPNSCIPADIRNDPRFSNAPAKECKVEFEKNKGRFLSSTMTALVQQRPLPEGEERIHGVLVRM